MMTNQNRLLGGLYGSLVGDALGVPVEFISRLTLKHDPVVSMRGQGTHGQPAGTWSDDGSLLLCSVESLVKKGFDTQDMGERFLRWYELGLWSAHGTIFDIGNATRAALDLISLGTPAENAGGQRDHDNGNGSLMRILPVVLSSLDAELETFADRIQRASSITHGHPRSKMACVFHGLMVQELMRGKDPHQALAVSRDHFFDLFEHACDIASFHDLLHADLAQWPESKVHSGGYVLETLTASIWCLVTSSSYAECVLKAVNLGSDTDTTGCVAGGLAGVLYGMNSIPEAWVLALPRQDDLRNLLNAFATTLAHEA